MVGILPVLVGAEVDEDAAVGKDVPVPVAVLRGLEVSAAEVYGEEVLVPVGLKQSMPLPGTHRVALE